MESTTRWAPGVAPPEAISKVIRNADSGECGEKTLAQLTLPPHVLETLAAEGIRDLGDWRQLGRQRFRIFGVTRATVGLLDAAARRAAP